MNSSLAKNGQLTAENSESHPPEPSAPPHSTPAADGNSTAVVAAPALPHLQDLTDRARGYVEAASSAHTRRAYQQAFMSRWRQ